MDKLRIQGGRQLHGEIIISGAKNAALPILCASLLSHGTLKLSAVPNLVDIDSTLKLLAQMGVTFERSPNAISLNASAVHHFEAPYNLVKTMRASILTLGPLLSRFGRARVSLPGGCAIGARPVDIHLKGLQAMGADIRVEHGYIEASTRHLPQQRLQGTHYCMDLVSVTGTENLMMAACLARGTTVLENAAKEPEVVDLAACLKEMGAQIEGAGSDVVCIHGVSALNGAQHRIVFDRIEAGTYLVAVAMTGGYITLGNARQSFMDAVLEKLHSAGAEITCTDNSISLRSDGCLKAVNIRTAPHPAFPTDMQAQFMAMNCVARGTSTVVETIFENRFMHAQELQRLGAEIAIEGNLAVVKGVPSLQGATVMATDLRASAGLVLASLVAQGETIIERIYHLDRGYDRLEEKLRILGANIERIAP